jgi:hypothetical protein
VPGWVHHTSTDNIVAVVVVVVHGCRASQGALAANSKATLLARILALSSACTTVILLTSDAALSFILFISLLRLRSLWLYSMAILTTAILSMALAEAAYYGYAYVLAHVAVAAVVVIRVLSR